MRAESSILAEALDGPYELAVIDAVRSDRANPTKCPSFNSDGLTGTSESTSWAAQSPGEDFFVNTVVWNLRGSLAAWISENTPMGAATVPKDRPRTI